MAFSLVPLWPLSFLILAVIDDLCFKKFHNGLFIALTIVGALSLCLWSELSAVEALAGFAVGGALMLPLVLLGAIGAGDMKFMMCFGLIMGAIAIFQIFLYALLWGACIGILRALLSGKIAQLWFNLVGLAYKVKPRQTEKIPYTVAIFLAWASHLQFGGIL